MTTLAIDIGGTKLAAALVADDMLIRDRRELSTPASKTPDALRAALQALIAPLQEQAKRVAIASTASGVRGPGWAPANDRPSGVSFQSPRRGVEE